MRECFVLNSSFSLVILCRSRNTSIFCRYNTYNRADVELSKTVDYILHESEKDVEEDDEGERDGGE